MREIIAVTGVWNNAPPKLPNLLDNGTLETHANLSDIKHCMLIYPICIQASY